MTCETGIIDRAGLKQAWANSAVRIVAVGARHATFQNWMVRRLQRIGPAIRVTGKTNYRLADFHQNRVTYSVRLMAAGAGYVGGRVGASRPVHGRSALVTTHTGFILHIHRRRLRALKNASWRRAHLIGSHDGCVATAVAMAVLAALRFNARTRIGLYHVSGMKNAGKRWLVVTLRTGLRCTGIAQNAARGNIGRARRGAWRQRHQAQGRQYVPKKTALHITPSLLLGGDEVGFAFVKHQRAFQRDIVEALLRVARVN